MLNFCEQYIYFSLKVNFVRNQLHFKHVNKCVRHFNNMRKKLHFYQIFCVKILFFEKLMLVYSNLYASIPDKKKKRNSKIFPFSFPFNAKMLIVIKY